GLEGLVQPGGLQTGVRPTGLVDGVAHQKGFPGPRIVSPGTPNVLSAASTLPGGLSTKAGVSGPGVTGRVSAPKRVPSGALRIPPGRTLPGREAARPAARPAAVAAAAFDAGEAAVEVVVDVDELVLPVGPRPRMWSTRVSPFLSA